MRTQSGSDPSTKLVVNSRRSDSAGQWMLPGTVTQGNLW